MRKISLVAAALFFTAVAFGQARFGVKAVLNYSEIDSKNNNNLNFYNGGIGGGLGFLYELPVTSRIAVQPEISLSFRQAEANYLSQKLSTAYFEVPVLFKYLVPDAKLAFLAGPQLSFLSSAHYSMGEGSRSDWKDNLIQTDFGLAFGVEHRPDKTGINYGLRVAKGLTNIIKAEYDGGTKSRSLAISAFIGILF